VVERDKLIRKSKKRNLYANLKNRGEKEEKLNSLLTPEVKGIDRPSYPSFRKHDGQEDKNLKVKSREKKGSMKAGLSAERKSPRCSI